MSGAPDGDVTDRSAKQVRHVSRGMSLLNLALGYVAAFGGASLLSLIGGQPFVAIVLLIGSLVALPFLAVAAAVLTLAHSSVRAHLKLWCALAPAVVVIAWLGAEYLGDFRARGFDLLAYLQIRSVWERAVLVLVCASLAAISFYLLERRAER